MTDRPDYHARVDRIKSRLASDEEIERDWENDQLELARKLELLLSSAEVPARIRKTLQELQPTPYVRRAQQWQGEGREQWCLILGGPVGAGKSTAAAWWLRDMLLSELHSTSPVPRLWYPATDLSRIDFYSREFDGLCRARALVIDDLGTEYFDEHGAFARTLDSLIDARYRDYRPTLITTNLNVGAFRKHYGDRVTDRLREGGSYFESAAPSLRRRAS